ncbi:MAG: hypothetical protein V4654_02980 [Bdellovibrionota bacterium]
MRMKYLGFVIVTVWLGFAHAYEVDNFTGRYKPLADSTAILNAEVNARLKKAVVKVNKKGILSRLKNNGSCSTADLYSAVSDELVGGLVGSLEDYAVGELEDYAEKNKKVHKSNLEEDGIIYSSSAYQGPVLNWLGVEPSINLKGHYIGIDKLGHFFDEGIDYYRLDAKTKGSAQVKIDKILAYGNKLENGNFGLDTTGIKSYGDLAANYGGYLFWSRLTTGVNPYFKCSAGTWVQIREFDWDHYVNPAWDEAVNCSTYVAGFGQDVAKEQKKLELKAGSKKKYTCPVSVTQCRRMVKYYGNKASQIISPTCLNLAKTKPSDRAEDDYYSTQPISSVPKTRSDQIKNGGTGR